MVIPLCPSNTTVGFTIRQSILIYDFPPFTAPAPSNSIIRRSSRSSSSIRSTPTSLVASCPTRTLPTRTSASAYSVPPSIGRDTRPTRLWRAPTFAHNVSPNIASTQIIRRAPQSFRAASSFLSTRTRRACLPSQTSCRMARLESSWASSSWRLSSVPSARSCASLSRLLKVEF